MQPNLRYIGVVTLTILSLLGFGMALADVSARKFIKNS